MIGAKPSGDDTYKATKQFEINSYQPIYNIEENPVT
jgi:hypothetical protein